MSKSIRTGTILFMALIWQLVLAQDAKRSSDTSGGFWDHLALINQTWWISTLIATALLGLLVGSFAYRNAVGNGRASGATGSGCLVAVIVFLLAQLITVCFLASTIFIATNSTPKAQTDAKSNAKPSTTASPADSTGLPPPKTDTPATKPSGDDF